MWEKRKLRRGIIPGIMSENGTSGGGGEGRRMGFSEEINRG